MTCSIGKLIINTQLSIIDGYIVLNTHLFCKSKTTDKLGYLYLIAITNKVCLVH